MSTPLIRIVHIPTGYSLCVDGLLRSGYAAGFGGEDTLTYKTIRGAMKRMTTKAPGRKLKNQGEFALVWTDIHGREFRMRADGAMIGS
jgi:hypothetical protein